ncbi:alpha/beta hydrolase [Chitinimonas naiadis]
MTENYLEIVDCQPPAASAKPPLLFLHGAYAGAWCWQPNFLPYFAGRGYRSYALSLRGHGGSEGRQYLSVTAVADYVADVALAVRQIEASCGQLPVLIGHSMGGFLALAYARERAVPGLVLLASVPPEGLMGSALNMFWQHPQLLWELNLLQHGGAAPHLKKLRELLFSPDMDEQQLLGYAGHFQHESDRALVEMTMPQFDLRPPVGMPPALVLGSEGDKLMRPHLVHSAARHLGVEAVLLPEVGHMLMLDTAWRSAADAIAPWLETLP